MEQHITHACGHEQVHHLPGFPAQQARKAHWLRTTQCRICFVAGRRASEAAAATRDGAAIAALILADLVGSERQIAWATVIRTKRLAGLVMAQGIAPIADHSCLAVSDAKWWIDRRDLADAELLAFAVAPAMHAA